MRYEQDNIFATSTQMTFDPWNVTCEGAHVAPMVQVWLQLVFVSNEI